MNRCIVNFATGDRHQRGQKRLSRGMDEHATGTAQLMLMRYFPGWRRHEQFPYAFKCHALKEAASMGFRQLLWCDACIVSVASIEPIWEHAARHGAWISRNGFSNYQWTAESAYRPLFGLDADGWPESPHAIALSLDHAKELNHHIEHVVAGAFALNLDHRRGQMIFDQYCRLGLETDAFVGPWKNSPAHRCGPDDVHGHRHDQSSLSVCAWRAGVPLTSPPQFLAYGKPEEMHHPETILLADGSYE